MAESVDGRRFATLFLAASLGLNIALGGILIFQGARKEEPEQNRSRRDYQGRDWRRSDWDSRSRAMPDSLRPYTRLEPEQLERMRELRRAMFEDIGPLGEEIRTLQELIRQELRKPEPDITRLDSITTRTADLQNQIQQRSIRLILEEREILTPEQYRALTRFMVPGFMPYDPGGGRYERGRGRESGRGRGDNRDSRPPPGPEPPPGVNPQIQDHHPHPEYALV